VGDCGARRRRWPIEESKRQGAKQRRSIAKLPALTEQRLGVGARLRAIRSRPRPVDEWTPNAAEIARKLTPTFRSGRRMGRRSHISSTACLV
jgi:hypothetical protein